jgi:hypothetical protein
MAADFYFLNPTYTIQSLKAVAAFKWQHLSDEDIKYSIAAEEQYLDFHLFMLENLRHTKAGEIANPPYVYELGLSVRATAIKAAVLIAASIIEAALRAIAESKAYPLNEDPRRRTFGNVIKAWEQNGEPRPEVAEIWPAVRAIHEVRNFVHLHKAAKNDKASWGSILESEEGLLNGALQAIQHISQIAA